MRKFVRIFGRKGGGSAWESNPAQRPLSSVLSRRWAASTTRATVLLWLTAVCGAAPATAQTPPNILAIVTDDQRAEQVLYMPNLMALAAESVRFNRAFVASPLCSPNRSSLLTGLAVHMHRIDCNDLAAARFHTSYAAQHLGAWLQASGEYYTCYVGKWMNGVEQATMPFWPYVAPGWDEWHVFVGQGGYDDYKLIQKIGTGTATVTRYTEYSTTKLGTLVRQCIERAPAEKPVFVIYAPKAPHAPHQMEFEADKHHGAPFPDTPATNEADVSDKPAYIQQLPLLTSTEMTAARNQYKKQVGQLQSLDRQIPLLRERLTLTGRWDTTYVFYTSDNGYLAAEHRLLNGKSCAYDPCVRVPFFVRVPGATPRVDDRLVSTLDLTSTIVQLAGVTPPWELNGRNLLPLIADPTIAWRHELLVELLQEDNHRPPFRMIVADDGSFDTYVEYLHGETEFYPLDVDPNQLQNAATDPTYAARVIALQLRLAVLSGLWATAH